MAKTCANCEKYRRCPVFDRIRNMPCKDYKQDNSVKERKG